MSNLLKLFLILFRGYGGVIDKQCKKMDNSFENAHNHYHTFVHAVASVIVVILIYHSKHGLEEREWGVI